MDDFSDIKSMRSSAHILLPYEEFIEEEDREDNLPTKTPATKEEQNVSM